MVRKRFITPADIPEEEICRGLVLPNSRDWLGVFSEALSQTIYPYNYEQINDTDLTPEAAADEAYERYTAWLDAVCAGGICVLPGGQRIYRTKKVTETETVYQYLDGEDWIDDEDIPPTPARTETTDDEKLCAASANAVNALYLTWLETKEYYEASISAQDAQVDTAIFISGLIGTFFYPPIAGLFVLAQAGWEIVYYAYEIVSAVDWDEPFTDKLTCIFLEHATINAGVVGFDTEAILKTLWTAGFTGEAYLTIVAQIEYLINQIGKPAIDAAGALTAVEGNCGNCGEWFYTFDFTTAGSQGWIAVRETASFTSAPGAYNGAAWIQTLAIDTSNGQSHKIMLGRQFDETTLTGVKVTYNRANGQIAWAHIANRIRTNSWDSGVSTGTGTVIRSDNTPGATGTGITLENTGEWDEVNCILVSLSASIRSGAVPNPIGTIAITRISLSGIGINPFGLDNCMELI